MTSNVGSQEEALGEGGILVDDGHDADAVIDLVVASIPLSLKIFVVKEEFKILFASALPLASILTFSASFLADSSLNSYSRDICS